MNGIFKYTFRALSCLLAAMAISCVDDVDVPRDMDGVISFVVTKDAETKAAMTMSTMTEFTCSAFITGTVTDPYFSLVQFTGSGAPKTFSSADDYYWPRAGLDFYAYSPSSDAQVSRQNFRTLTVTPSSDPAQQADLVVACATGRTRASDGATGTALNFRHAMSRITVKVKNSSPDLRFVVTGWKVGYLDGNATYAHPSGLSTDGAGTLPVAAWSGNDSPSAATTYTVSLSVPVAVAPSTSMPAALGGEIFLIPQAVSAATGYTSPMAGSPVNGSYIAVEIVIVDVATSLEVVPRTWAAWPAALSWEPGRMYTYVVDLAGGGYYLTNNGGDANLDPILEGVVIPSGDDIINGCTVQSYLWLDESVPE